ncbi:MAG: LLM class flavin-dependent oxidoreductase [Thermomicrobiales bacterium]
MPQPRISIGMTVPPTPPLGSLKQIIWVARLLRLDSLVVWDHLQDLFPTALWDNDFTWLAKERPSPHEFYDFQTILGYIAGRAGRLQIGVAVTEPIRRHPILIAQSLITLSQLTKKPPILGIGAGERENIEPFGFDWSHPVGKVEEALQIFRLCFGQRGPITFQGKHFQIDDAPMDLRPPKNRTPRIWVGAHGPRMLRLTGAYGDAWYPVGLMLPDEYAEKLEVVRTAAREAGRKPDDVLPSLNAYVVVAPTREEARAMIDTKVIRYLGVLAPAEMWRKIGRTHPLGDDFRGHVDVLPHRFTRDEFDDLIARVPTELSDQGLIWGTPADVAAQLRTYGEAGLRHAILQIASAAISRKAALYSARALRAIAKELHSTR